MAEKCGNIVQVLHGEKPLVMCCGQPMDRLVANTVDAAQEKHDPVVEKIDSGYLVDEKAGFKKTIGRNILWINMNVHYAGIYTILKWETRNPIYKKHSPHLTTKKIGLSSKFQS